MNTSSNSPYFMPQICGVFTTESNLQNVGSDQAGYAMLAICCNVWGIGEPFWPTTQDVTHVSFNLVAYYVQLGYCLPQYMVTMFSFLLYVHILQTFSSTRSRGFRGVFILLAPPRIPSSICPPIPANLPLQFSFYPYISSKNPPSLIPY